MIYQKGIQYFNMYLIIMYIINMYILYYSNVCNLISLHLLYI